MAEGEKVELGDAEDIEESRKVCPPDFIPCAQSDVPREATTVEACVVLATLAMGIGGMCPGLGEMCRAR